MKTFIISGASRGVGCAVAKQLIEEGHKVVGLSRSHSIIHERYVPKKVDLSELGSLPNQLRVIESSVGPVDGLICNAGVWHYGFFEELKFEEIRHIVDLNLLSHLYLVNAFLPQMKKCKQGQILFIESEEEGEGGAMESVYASCRSALEAFAKSLAKECQQFGIEVSSTPPHSLWSKKLLIPSK